jgi:ABC-2 type transport system ATP-binding protein
MTLHGTESSAANPAGFAPGERREIIATVRNVQMYFFGEYVTRALDRMNFQVFRGEIFGLFGPRGCGKSTTLRLLAGVLSPDEGKIRVFCRSPQRGAIRVRIGYLPQNAGDDRRPGLARILKRVGRWFSPMQKPRRNAVLASPPGNSRCFELALALRKDPELVLLDEPFSGLDPAGCEEMRKLIRDLARRGKTIVLSAASLAPAVQICDRVALFFRGRIEAAGTLEELMESNEVIRLTAPLLSPATSERVLEVIRHELCRQGPALETPTAGIKRNSSDGPRAASGVKSSTTAPSAEEILAPLLIAVPVQPRADHPAETRSSVDHEKLAKLAEAATRGGQADKTVSPPGEHGY